MMRVSLLQIDIRWADIDANIAAVEALLSGVPQGDLYVLPEMWSTGFVMEPQGIAEPEHSSRALDWMRRKAQELGAAFSGSIAIVTADGEYRNRHYFVTPDGMSHYDKHHLFAHGHEDRYYTAGSEQVVVSYRGWRFLLLTCYDLRFPVWSRYRCDAAFDAVIVVANWPQSRQRAWDILTRARAVENQAYLIAVNRVGDDPRTHYLGGSRVVSPLGDDVACCPADIPGSVTVELDIDKLQSMRSRFRVLDDADAFSLLMPASRR